uniref:Hypotheticial protein n=1 Tax=Meloidogyne hapla TaxID=6305 RepID=A0A1I8BEL2_MELHA
MIGMLLMVMIFVLIVNGAPTPKKDVVYVRRKDIFPCPNCEDWCKDDPKFSCDYSCDYKDDVYYLTRPCEEYNDENYKIYKEDEHYFKEIQKLVENKTCIYVPLYYPL